MKLELHILQNFAPSNLNRDDTGAPKDCEFGGHRRGRISSQCLKRAARAAFETHGLLAPNERAARTKRLVGAVADLVSQQHQRPRDLAAVAATHLLEGGGLKVKEDAGEAKTEYLLFVPRRVVESLVGLAHEHWDALLAVEKADTGEGETKKKTAKQQKQQARAAVPPELAKAVSALLADATQTPELALFGRMIADQPSWNVDAACQVAHAMSTNRVNMEFDFYTAVDDLRSKDTTGSDMMGTVQLQSSCFYRYSVVDLDALESNLGEGEEAAQAALRVAGAYLEAAIRSIPTGKQNGTAAHNPPSYVLAVLRKGAPISLANAFAKPARPSQDYDLVDNSIEALERYRQDIERAYGGDSVLALSLADRDLGPRGGIERVGSLRDMITRVVDRARTPS